MEAAPIQNDVIPFLIHFVGESDIIFYSPRQDRCILLNIANVSLNLNDAKIRVDLIS